MLATNVPAIVQCRFRQHGVHIRKGSRFDEKGNTLKQADPAAHSAAQDALAARDRMIPKYGKESFVLGWHEIRQPLYQSLPEGVVIFDKQVTVVSQHTSSKSPTLNTCQLCQPASELPIVTASMQHATHLYAKHSASIYSTVWTDSSSIRS